MEISQNQRALGSIAIAISFGLLLAATAPTRPRPMGESWRASIKPVAPPAPADFAGYAAALSAVPGYPVEYLAYDGDPDATVSDDVTVHRGRAADEDPQPAAAQDVAYREDLPLAAPSPPAHGYRDGAVPRDCRGTAGDEAGCLVDIFGRGDDGVTAGDADGTSGRSEE
jgi:hypothetical protein